VGNNRRRSIATPPSALADCTPLILAGEEAISNLTAPRVVAGGPLHSVQLRVNLPAALKLTPPRYQAITKDELTYDVDVPAPRIGHQHLDVA
jgi:hypothetical protein